MMQIANTVRLYQGFWSASDKDTFNELYGYTQDIYENAYSCADLMKVIKVVQYRYHTG